MSGVHGGPKCPILLMADQAAPSDKKRLKNGKLLFGDLCLAIKTHRMRKTKNTCESIYKMRREIFIQDTYIILQF